jgi:hypothetical protein
MLISPELLAKHLEYSLWASLQVLEAAARLPEAALEANRGNSFGGILATLQHIYRADRVWSRRMGGEPAAPFAVAGESLTVREMRGLWPGALNLKKAVGTSSRLWQQLVAPPLSRKIPKDPAQHFRPSLVFG